MDDNDFISYKKMIIFGSEGSGKTPLIKLMNNYIKIWDIEDIKDAEDIEDLEGASLPINYYKTKLELEK